MINLSSYELKCLAEALTYAEKDHAPILTPECQNFAQTLRFILSKAKADHARITKVERAEHFEELIEEGYEPTAADEGAQRAYPCL